MHTLPSSRSWRMRGVRIPLTVALCSATVVQSQAPPLTPTIDTTIIVPNGALHYSSMFVPTGVTVRFVRPTIWPPPLMPAVIICDGDSIVHGTVSVAGVSVAGYGFPAGGVITGRGADGYSCSSVVVVPPEGGRHAGSYGSILPFSLEGGSPGGELVNWVGPSCTQFASRFGGGEGGGTLALLAGGRIEIHGTVTADGEPFVGGGSGGLILLRGGAGVTILPGGSVTARGGSGFTASPPWPPLRSYGAPGYIRLDAWGTPPTILGTVDPVPTVIELPHIRSLSAPRIGTTWSLDVFAPENTPVFAAAAPLPGNGVPTPFGPLGIDFPSHFLLAYGLFTPPGHDPMVNVSTAVPNSQALVGSTFWVQAFVAPAALPARFSNTLAVTVQ